MKIATLVLGILSVSTMILAITPCLGWINWVNFPIAITGLIFGIISYNEKNNQPKSDELIGIILCSIALIFGMFRLILGGGII